MAPYRVRGDGFNIQGRDVRARQHTGNRATLRGRMLRLGSAQARWEERGQPRMRAATLRRGSGQAFGKGNPGNRGRRRNKGSSRPGYSRRTRGTPPHTHNFPNGLTFIAGRDGKMQEVLGADFDGFGNYGIRRGGPGRPGVRRRRTWGGFDGWIVRRRRT